MLAPGVKSADATSKISARRFAESHIPGNVTPGRDPEISRPGPGNPRSGVGCQIFPDPGPDREISGKVSPGPESGRIPEFPVRTGNFGKSAKSWGVAGISGKPRSGPGSGRDPGIPGIFRSGREISGNSGNPGIPRPGGSGSRFRGGFREFPGNPGSGRDPGIFRSGREISGNSGNPGNPRPGVSGTPVPGGIREFPGNPARDRPEPRNWPGTRNSRFRAETRPESGPGTPKLGRN